MVTNKSHQTYILYCGPTFREPWSHRTQLLKFWIHHWYFIFEHSNKFESENIDGALSKTVLEKVSETQAGIDSLKVLSFYHVATPDCASRHDYN